MKKILFLDRDGTLILEPADYQIDSLAKLRYYPGVFTWLGRISRECGYTLVMVTNQDGLGTARFPEETFWPAHQAMLEAFAGEGITFESVHIDRSFPEDNAPTRKPRTGMLTNYLERKAGGEPLWDIANSFVIGDRLTDVELAHNLGSKAIWLNTDPSLGAGETSGDPARFDRTIALQTTSWEEVYRFLRLHTRTARVHRVTHETDVLVELDLDGKGKADIYTGLGFFDHMLHQIARHAGVDLRIAVRGDLEVDEHHTIEDTAIALGEAFYQALADKAGLARYGFALPMDDSLARVALDFGGRSWLVWKVKFERERIGDMPTEMFYHFFKSFADAARCNLNIRAKGENEHHKIESIFKGLARALRMAIRRDPDGLLPSTKGAL